MKKKWAVLITLANTHVAIYREGFDSEDDARNYMQEVAKTHTTRTIYFIVPCYSKSY